MWLVGAPGAAFNADFRFRHTAWSVPECTAFLLPGRLKNLAYLRQLSFAILDRK